MQIFAGHASLPRPFGPSAVGIGIFDGVHLGHQKLLGKVVELAQADKLTSVTYTFNPHPARVLAPALAPRLIETLEVRLERIAALGVNATVVEPFTRELAAVPAEVFARQILGKELAARHVVVGADFKFGHKQSGNVALLESIGREVGYAVHPVEIERAGGIVVSSTKVREFVWAGAVRGAHLLLGRPFAITGVVVRGAGRGNKLGFATANLETHSELVPAVGVYAARANEALGTHPAVVNVGYAPTFGENKLKIEAHLLDYQGGPLYGLALQLEFIDRLRDEKRFASVEDLVAQIGLDVAQARAVLAALP